MYINTDIYIYTIDIFLRDQLVVDIFTVFLQAPIQNKTIKTFNNYN